MDWGGLMRAGMGRDGGLGLRPDQFWRLTPMELRLMLGEGQTALTRAGLDQLVAAYPDETKGK
jgi:uncharacterized phage protein (TIGR02216 family)